MRMKVLKPGPLKEGADQNEPGNVSEDQTAASNFIDQADLVIHPFGKQTNH